MKLILEARKSSEKAKACKKNGEKNIQKEKEKASIKSQQPLKPKGRGEKDPRL